MHQSPRLLSVRMTCKHNLLFGNSQFVEFILRSLQKPALFQGRIKSNSHQTIFPTNFQRQPTIEKSVVVGRWCDLKIGGVRHQQFLFLKVGRFSHRFSPLITPRKLSNMFDKIGGNPVFRPIFMRIGGYLKS